MVKREMPELTSQIQGSDCIPDHIEKQVRAKVSGADWRLAADRQLDLQILRLGRQTKGRLKRVSPMRLLTYSNGSSRESVRVTSPGTVMECTVEIEDRLPPSLLLGSTQ